MELTKCSELGNGAMDHIALVFGVTKPLLKSLASLGLDGLSLKCPFT